MDRAFVTWDQDVVRIDEAGRTPHPLLTEQGFYCLLAARLEEGADRWVDLDLLYVGASHEATLRGALLTARPEHQRARELAAAKGLEVVAMLGQITESTLGRLSRPFVEDVEACLSQRNEAAVSQLPADYKPRRHLSVVNRGDFAPLAWRSLFRLDA